MEEAFLKVVSEAVEANKCTQEELTELYFDAKVKAEAICGLSDFPNIEIVSLNNVGLKTLEGLPSSQKLKVRAQRRLVSPCCVSAYLLVVE